MNPLVLSIPPLRYLELLARLIHKERIANANSELCASANRKQWRVFEAKAKGTGKQKKKLFRPVHFFILLMVVFFHFINFNHEDEECHCAPVFRSLLTFHQGPLLDDSQKHSQIYPAAKSGSYRKVKHRI